MSSKIKQQSILETDTLHSMMMGDVEQRFMRDLVRQFELRDIKINKLKADNKKLKKKLSQCLDSALAHAAKIIKPKTMSNIANLEMLVSGKMDMNAYQRVLAKFELERLRRDLSIEANESRNLQHEVFNLENECAELKDLLRHSKCGNNKCKDGSIPYQEYPSGDWVADQCEWCYRVNKIKTQDNG